MSIVYVNPGFISLFDDNEMPSYESNDKKYTRCGRYVIPLDYKNWYTVYTSDRIFDWHIHFDVYANLSNKPFEDYEGFFRLCNYKHDITLSIDSLGNLVLSSGDFVLYRFDFEYDKINSYELRVYSKDDNEIIELWHNDKKIYDNDGKTKKYFDGEPLRFVKIKNIVYTPNEDNLRHGTALSNFVIGNSRVGDVCIEILDTDITTDWNVNNKEYITNQDGKYITQKIKNISKVEEIEANDDIVYCMAYCLDNIKASQNEIASFLVNDTRINETFIPMKDKKG